MERKIILRNIICSVGLQIVTMISGFIIPKVILTYFGSDVNGLISSINQFLNYIQLLEGGLSGVIMAALYKPLNENDDEKISRVIKATEQFFRKIAGIFCVYLVVIAVAYPLLFHTSFSFGYSVALVVVLGMNLFVQYFFSLTYRLLLNADRKVYVVSLTQITIIILNMIAVVACAKKFQDILIVKFISALIFIIQPVAYRIYVEKHYHLNKQVKPDNEALSQRWDGFGINLAYFVHTNTEVIILTFLSTLANVSVYSIYLMIVNAMKNLVISVSQAIIPSFGKALVSGKKEQIQKSFDLYEFGIDFITTFIFTSGLVLITPFVKVYTLGINDADYIQYGVGYLLVLAEMVYCLRDPYVSATYSAGKFKQVTKYAIWEVMINLVISLMFVHKWGLIGVVTGTCISMIYRMLAHILYLKRNVLYRKPWKAVRKIIVYGTTSLVVFILNTKWIVKQVDTYIEWFLLAMEVVIIVLIFVTVVSILFYKKEFNELIGNRIRLLWRKKNESRDGFR